MKRQGSGAYLIACTGRRVFPDNHIIGLNSSFDIFCGHVNFLDDVTYPREEGFLTLQERIEVADFMLKQWTEAKNRWVMERGESDE